MASPTVFSLVSIHCQAVLFDMDGILVSSIGSVERTWRKWAMMRGVDPARTLELAHGRRAIELLAAMRPDLDSEAELKIVEEIEIGDNEDLRVLPGVLELLRVLPRERWTVVTSATERLAQARLEFGGVPVPERLVTADHVTRGKPHPEPFLAGASLLGFAPRQCVVFEDSASGAQAGREAGCTVIATTFSQPLERLQAAHYLLEDLTAVTAQAGPEGLTLSLTPLLRGD
ncbi:MAG TPA: HAD-IA family hydrolase [Terracidiphilus sp.]|nr:HAD-IA family hydrolase [Terracidiphilus sp.]